MTITPQDIQAKQFHVRMRGFDMDEVDKFLEKVAEEFLIVTLENKQLQEKVESMEKELANYRNKEQAFQSAILSAQRISDEMQTKSRQEAEEIVANAKQTAQELEERGRREVEELTESSRREAEEMRENAEAEARRIIENSKQEHLELTAQINRLIEIKDRILTDLRQMLTGYMDKIEESVPSGLNALEPLPTENPAAPAPSEENDAGQAEEAEAEQDNPAAEDLEDLYEKIDLPDENIAESFAFETAGPDQPATLGIEDIEPIEDRPLEESESGEDLAPSIPIEELNEEEEKMLFSLEDDSLEDDPLDDLEPSISISEEDKDG